MREWAKLPGLAEFPGASFALLMLSRGVLTVKPQAGTVYLGDQRDRDPRYESQPLSKEDTLRAQPGLSESAVANGATLYPQEGVLTLSAESRCVQALQTTAPDLPCTAGFAYLPKATHAFLEEAQQRGARIHFNAQVLRLQRGPDSRLSGLALHKYGASLHASARAQQQLPCCSSDQSVRAGVSTASGDFPADFVVLAAGLGAPELAESVDAAVPLTYKPGTVNILTPPTSKLLNHIVVTGALPAATDEPPT